MQWWSGGGGGGCSRGGGGNNDLMLGYKFFQGAVFYGSQTQSLFGRYQLIFGLPKLSNVHARPALSNCAIHVSPEVTHIGFFSLPLLDQRIPGYPPNSSITSRLS